MKKKILVQIPVTLGLGIVLVVALWGVRQNLENRGRAAEKCDGWAEIGSVHCNTDQCKQYLCDGGSWKETGVSCGSCANQSGAQPTIVSAPVVGQSCTEGVVGLDKCCGDGLIGEKYRKSDCSEEIRCSKSWAACKGQTVTQAPVVAQPSVVSQMSDSCASGWVCNGVCADSGAVSLFNSVWCDGKARWLLEAGCGGNGSVTKSSGACPGVTGVTGVPGGTIVSGGSNVEISDRAKQTMEAKMNDVYGNKGCSGGLCPAIDPKTGVITGYVPADRPVYMTLEQAQIARLNLSIGNLETEVKLADGTTLKNVFDYNWQNKDPKSFLTNDDLVKAQAEIEKNKVKYDESGAVVTTATGDIMLKDESGVLSKAEFEKRNVAFEQEQAYNQAKIQESVAKEAEKVIESCAVAGNCSKVSDDLARLSGFDVLTKDKQESLNKAVVDLATKREAEVRVAREKEKEAEALRAAQAQRAAQLTPTAMPSQAVKQASKVTDFNDPMISKSDKEKAVFNVAVTTVIDNASANINSFFGNMVIGAQNLLGAKKEYLGYKDLAQFDLEKAKAAANETLYKNLVTDKNSQFYDPEVAAKYRMIAKNLGVDPNANVNNDPSYWQNLENSFNQGVAAGSKKHFQETVDKVVKDPMLLLNIHPIFQVINTARTGDPSNLAPGLSYLATDPTVVTNWNQFTGGRFKRGNETLMEGIESGDTLQQIRGALMQGGDAAMVTTAIVAAPLAVPMTAVAAPVALFGSAVGVGAAPQMIGAAADTCENYYQGEGATGTQCLTSTALAVTATLSVGTGALSQSSSLLTTTISGQQTLTTLGKVVKTTETVVTAVNVPVFTEMAVETCSQEAVSLNCVSSALMAAASTTRLVGNVGAAKLPAYEQVMKKVEAASANTFAASACGNFAFDKLTGDFKGAESDEWAMCMMGLSGVMSHASAQKAAEEAKKTEFQKEYDSLAKRAEELAKNKNATEAEKDDFEVKVEELNQKIKTQREAVETTVKEKAEAAKTRAEELQRQGKTEEAEKLREAAKKAEQAATELQTASIERDGLANQKVSETLAELATVATVVVVEGGMPEVPKTGEVVPPEKIENQMVDVKVSKEAKQTLSEAAKNAENSGKSVVGEQGLLKKEAGSNKLVVNETVVTDQAQAAKLAEAAAEVNAIVATLEQYGKASKGSGFAMTEQQLTDFVGVVVSDNPVVVLSAQTGYGKSLVAGQALTVFYAKPGEPVMMVYADANYRLGAAQESFHTMYEKTGIERVFFDRENGWRRLKVGVDGQFNYENLTVAQVEQMANKGKLAVLTTDSDLHFGIQGGGADGKLLVSVFDKATVIADEGSKYIQAGKNYRTQTGEGKALLTLKAEDSSLGMSYEQVQKMRREVLEGLAIKTLREGVVSRLAEGKSSADLVDPATGLPRSEETIAKIYREAVESSNSPIKEELLKLDDVALRKRLLQPETLADADLMARINTVNIEMEQLAQVPGVTFNYGADGTYYILAEGGTTKQTKSTILETLAANETGRQMYDAAAKRAGEPVAPPLDLSRVKVYDQATQTNGLGLFLGKNGGRTIVMDATPDLVAKGLGEMKGSKVVGVAPPLIEPRKVVGVASGVEAVGDINQSSTINTKAEFVALRKEVVQEARALQEAAPDKLAFDKAMKDARTRAEERVRNGGTATERIDILADKIVALDRAQTKFENVRILNTATGEVSAEVSKAIAEQYKGVRDHHIINPDANVFEIKFKDGTSRKFTDIAEYKKFVEGEYYAGGAKGSGDFVLEVQHRHTGLNLAVDPNARWSMINDTNTTLDTAVQGTGRDRLYSEVVREMENAGRPPSADNFEADIRIFLREHPEFGNAELFGPDHYIVGAKPEMTVAEAKVLYKTNQVKAEQRTRQETLVKVVEAKTVEAIEDARRLALKAAEEQYSGLDLLGGKKKAKEAVVAEINAHYDAKLAEQTREAQLRNNVINTDPSHGGVALKNALEAAQAEVRMVAEDLKSQLEARGKGSKYSEFENKWKPQEKLAKPVAGTGIDFKGDITVKSKPITEAENFVALEKEIAARYTVDDLPADNRKGAGEAKTAEAVVEARKPGGGPGEPAAPVKTEEAPAQERQTAWQQVQKRVEQARDRARAFFVGLFNKPKEEKKEPVVKEQKTAEEQEKNIEQQPVQEEVGQPQGQQQPLAETEREKQKRIAAENAQLVREAADKREKLLTEAEQLGLGKRDVLNGTYTNKELEEMVSAKKTEVSVGQRVENVEQPPEGPVVQTAAVVLGGELGKRSEESRSKTQQTELEKVRAERVAERRKEILAKIKVIKPDFMDDGTMSNSQLDNERIKIEREKLALEKERKGLEQGAEIYGIVSVVGETNEQLRQRIAEMQAKIRELEDQVKKENLGVNWQEGETMEAFKSRVDEARNKKTEEAERQRLAEEAKQEAEAKTLADYKTSVLEQNPGLNDDEKRRIDSVQNKQEVDKVVSEMKMRVAKEEADKQVAMIRVAELFNIYVGKNSKAEDIKVEIEREIRNLEQQSGLVKQNGETEEAFVGRAQKEIKRKEEAEAAKKLAEKETKKAELQAIKQRLAVLGLKFGAEGKTKEQLDKLEQLNKELIALGTKLPTVKGGEEFENYIERVEAELEVKIKIERQKLLDAYFQKQKEDENLSNQLGENVASVALMEVLLTLEEVMEAKRLGIENMARMPNVIREEIRERLEGEQKQAEWLQQVLRVTLDKEKARLAIEGAKIESGWQEFQNRAQKLLPSPEERKLLSAPVLAEIGSVEGVRVGLEDLYKQWKALNPTKDTSSILLLSAPSEETIVRLKLLTEWQKKKEEAEALLVRFQQIQQQQLLSTAKDKVRKLGELTSEEEKRLAGLATVVEVEAMRVEVNARIRAEIQRKKDEAAGVARLQKEKEVEERQKQVIKNRIIDELTNNFGLERLEFDQMEIPALETRLAELKRQERSIAEKMQRSGIKWGGFSRGKGETLANFEAKIDNMIKRKEDLDKEAAKKAEEKRRLEAERLAAERVARQIRAQQQAAQKLRETKERLKQAKDTLRRQYPQLTLKEGTELESANTLAEVAQIRENVAKRIVDEKQKQSETKEETALSNVSQTGESLFEYAVRLQAAKDRVEREIRDITDWEKEQLQKIGSIEGVDAFKKGVENRQLVVTDILSSTDIAEARELGIDTTGKGAKQVREEIITKKELLRQEVEQNKRVLEGSKKGGLAVVAYFESIMNERWNSVRKLAGKYGVEVGEDYDGALKGIEERRGEVKKMLDELRLNNIPSISADIERFEESEWNYSRLKSRVDSLREQIRQLKARVVGLKGEGEAAGQTVAELGDEVAKMEAEKGRLIRDVQRTYRRNMTPAERKDLKTIAETKARWQAEREKLEQEVKEEKLGVNWETGESWKEFAERVEAARAEKRELAERIRSGFSGEKFDESIMSIDDLENLEKLLQEKRKLEDDLGEKMDFDEQSDLDGARSVEEINRIRVKAESRINREKLARLTDLRERRNETSHTKNEAGWTRGSEGGKIIPGNEQGAVQGIRVGNRTGLVTSGGAVTIVEEDTRWLIVQADSLVVAEAIAAYPGDFETNRTSAKLYGEDRQNIGQVEIRDGKVKVDKGQKLVVVSKEGSVREIGEMELILVDGDVVLVMDEQWKGDIDGVKRAIDTARNNYRNGYYKSPLRDYIYKELKDIAEGKVNSGMGYYVHDVHYDEIVAARSKAIEIGLDKGWVDTAELGQIRDAIAQTEQANTAINVLNNELEIVLDTTGRSGQKVEERLAQVDGRIARVSQQREALEMAMKNLENKLKISKEEELRGTIKSAETDVRDQTVRQTRLKQVLEVYNGVVAGVATVVFEEADSWVTRERGLMASIWDDLSGSEKVEVEMVIAGLEAEVGRLREIDIALERVSKEGEGYKDLTELEQWTEKKTGELRGQLVSLRGRNDYLGLALKRGDLDLRISQTIEWLTRIQSSIGVIINAEREIWVTTETTEQDVVLAVGTRLQRMAQMESELEAVPREGVPTIVSTELEKVLSQLHIRLELINSTMEGGRLSAGDIVSIIGRLNKENEKAVADINLTGSDSSNLEVLERELSRVVLLVQDTNEAMKLLESLGVKVTGMGDSVVRVNLKADEISKLVKPLLTRREKLLEGSVLGENNEIDKIRQVSGRNGRFEFTKGDVAGALRMAVEYIEQRFEAVKRQFQVVVDKKVDDKEELRKMEEETKKQEVIVKKYQGKIKETVFRTGFLGLTSFGYKDADNLIRLSRAKYDLPFLTSSDELKEIERNVLMVGSYIEELNKIVQQVNGDSELVAVNRGQLLEEIEERVVAIRGAVEILKPLIDGSKMLTRKEKEWQSVIKLVAEIGDYYEGEMKQPDEDKWVSSSVVQAELKKIETKYALFEEEKNQLPVVDNEAYGKLMEMLDIALEQIGERLAEMRVLSNYWQQISEKNNLSLSGYRTDSEGNFSDYQVGVDGGQWRDIDFGGVWLRLMEIRDGKVVVEYNRSKTVKDPITDWRINGGNVVKTTGDEKNLFELGIEDTLEIMNGTGKGRKLKVFYDQTVEQFFVVYDQTAGALAEMKDLASEALKQVASADMTVMLASADKALDTRSHQNFVDSHDPIKKRGELSLDLINLWIDQVKARKATVVEWQLNHYLLAKRTVQDIGLANETKRKELVARAKVQLKDLEKQLVLLESYRASQGKYSPSKVKIESPKKVVLGDVFNGVEANIVGSRMILKVVDPQVELFVGGRTIAGEEVEIAEGGVIVSADKMTKMVSAFVVRRTKDGWIKEDLPLPWWNRDIEGHPASLAVILNNLVSVEGYDLFGAYKDGAARVLLQVMCGELVASKSQPIPGELPVLTLTHRAIPGAKVLINEGYKGLLEDVDKKIATAMAEGDGESVKELKKIKLDIERAKLDQTVDGVELLRRMVNSVSSSRAYRLVVMMNNYGVMMQNAYSTVSGVAGAVGSVMSVLSLPATLVAGPIPLMVGVVTDMVIGGTIDTTIRTVISFLRAPGQATRAVALLPAIMKTDGGVRVDKLLATIVAGWISPSTGFMSGTGFDVVTQVRTGESGVRVLEINKKTRKGEIDPTTEEVRLSLFGIKLAQFNPMRANTRSLLADTILGNPKFREATIKLKMTIARNSVFGVDLVKDLFTGAVLDPEYQEMKAMGDRKEGMVSQLRSFRSSLGKGNEVEKLNKRLMVGKRLMSEADSFIADIGMIRDEVNPLVMADPLEYKTLNRDLGEVEELLAELVEERRLLILQLEEERLRVRGIEMANASLENEIRVLGLTFKCSGALCVVKMPNDGTMVLVEGGVLEVDGVRYQFAKGRLVGVNDGTKVYQIMPEKSEKEHQLQGVPVLP